MTTDESERRASERLRAYRTWQRQPHEIDPIDAGREVEFAWGEAYDIGYAAALRARTASSTREGL